jgi:hypothetical protein
MILKNKALHIFDFLAAPADKLYERAARFQFKGLQGVMEGKGNYTGELIYALHYFPEIAAGLGPKLLQNPYLAQSLKAEPMAAMRLLATDYNNLAATVEPIVLSSGEATYHLLKLAEAGKWKLQQSPAAYHIALLRDAFWAVRQWGDIKDDTLLARALQFGEENKASLPAAAYIHLYFTPDADPTDHIELLSKSAMYAYLASRHFYDRGAEFKYFNLTDLTPRWAYHFITDGFLDDEEGLVETMLQSPDWLVEYLVESERYKDLPYTEGVYKQALVKAKDSPQLTYLKLWWERVQPYVAKINAAAKKTEKPSEKTS